MDVPKLPIRPPAPRFAFLSKNPSNTKISHRTGLCLSIASTLAASAFICLLIAYVAGGGPSLPARFGVIIDAGSSGTRIHVFALNGTRGFLPSLDLGSTTVMRVTPGLSSYAVEPDLAGESLLPLLEFARKKVGDELCAETEIRLMATGGLRMVEMGVRESILESCRTVLRSSGFHFRNEWASVIPGSDEGIYAWVAANYALDTLGGDPKATSGIIELGGASAQVAFVSSEALPSEFSHVLTFGGTTYNLYSNSFLHFGQNVAQESLRKLFSSRRLNKSTETASKDIFVDPCSPKGYSHAKPAAFNSSISDLKTEEKIILHSGGNFSECRSAAFTLLQGEKENCLYQQCYLGSAFIPKMEGNFIATENFFFTSKFFELDPTSPLSDLMLAGKRFCEEDLSELKVKYHTLNDEDLSRYCFSSAYIVALLNDSLKIDLDDRRITYTNQIGEVEVEWALGAFLVQMMSKVPNYTNRLNVWALLLLIASTLLIFTAWLVTKWRKPRLKTVFDLEKGRYIITRIS